jgi:hypothetical protein
MIRTHAAVPAIFFAIAAFTLFADESHSQIANYSPQVGQPHADFILPSIDDGSPIQLSDYRGKKVLLMHFASW